MRRLLPLAALALALLAACERDGPPPAVDLELRLHRGGEQLRLEPGDGRVPALAAELGALLLESVPARESLDRSGVGVAFARGAVEFRFAAPQRQVAADGDTLRFWRALVPLGIEPAPPGGGEGVLVLLGDPDYDPRPRLSRRSRENLLRILEGGPDRHP